MTKTAHSDTSSRYLALGPREREVMEIICELGGANISQISERLDAALAYTTVLTFVSRLRRKGMLQRQKKGRSYTYLSNLNTRELESRRAAELIRSYFSDSKEHPDLLLSCLVDAVQYYDAELLDLLEIRIRAARLAHLSSADSIGGVGKLGSEEREV
jgi:predicted transcriptional regulator